MYASDYPHGESHFPESVSLVLHWVMDAERKRKLLWDNAIRFYAGALARLAQKDPSEGLTSAPSASCESRPPNAWVSRAGVNKAVAGFVADVGMHEAPPQEAFTD
jgi:hypothetical protein